MDRKDLMLGKQRLPARPGSRSEAGRVMAVSPSAAPEDEGGCFSFGWGGVGAESPPAWS